MPSFNVISLSGKFSLNMVSSFFGVCNHISDLFDGWDIFSETFTGSDVLLVDFGSGVHEFAAGRTSILASSDTARD